MRGFVSVTVLADVRRTHSPAGHVHQLVEYLLSPARATSDVPQALPEIDKYLQHFALTKGSNEASESNFWRWLCFMHVLHGLMYFIFGSS
eukprot:s202_g5.t1